METPIPPMVAPPRADSTHLPSRPPPTLDEVKASGKNVGGMGSASTSGPPSGRGRHPAGCTCSLHKGRSGAPVSGTVAPVASLESAPVFAWKTEDMRFIGNMAPDLAYGLLGEGHEHFLEVKRASEPSYEKLAYVANRLQWTDPVYLVLTVALGQYIAALSACSMKSYRIEKAKVERHESERREKTARQDAGEKS